MRWKGVGGGGRCVGRRVGGVGAVGSKVAVVQAYVGKGMCEKGSRVYRGGVAWVRQVGSVCGRRGCVQWKAK